MREEHIDGECLANDRQTTAAGSGAVISSHAQYVAFMLRGAAVLRWHQLKLFGKKTATYAT